MIFERDNHKIGIAINPEILQITKEYISLTEDKKNISNMNLIILGILKMLQSIIQNIGYNIHNYYYYEIKEGNKND